MSVICPDGHTSASEDYCDQCGLPIGEQPVTGPPAVQPPTPPADPEPADARRCPHCGSVASELALFCESCGYDFTTGQPPRADVDPAGAGPGAPAPEADSGADPPGADPGAAQRADVDPAGPTWVLETWVDPEWHAAQDVAGSSPSAGMPVVTPLTSRSLLVGRTSESRNIHPEIDLATDTGVSRRHARLSTDGQRWWVEDLGSANGTYVGAAGRPLPDRPVEVGARVELEEDDRLYLGGWTRLVVRRATDAEREALGLRPPA